MPTHTGSCHCGAVAFEVDAELDSLIACNCSMCGRSGTVLTFVPEGSFRCLRGEASLTDYQFGKKHIHHLFCPVCGIKPFGWGLDPKTGGKMIAVNVRCIEGLDVRDLKPHFYDGAAI